ncbi:Bifunctional chorismate mutase/prephenate dehydratase [Geodia barretti]|uniref:Bifunctional chorismate mutase/prephenate dehydratase n=1 Tax=Geodia barretti TaxID=519541 RepID=A0AA35RBJ6_GEOBA|nr:Bifunctional chorismate mutase/prephenate dehydratase [Geodia barretti]
MAFLGPSGTYTEEAALLYDPAAELRPFPNITAVGMAVASGETPQGVVPIENSIEGSVNFTLDLLLSEGSLLIRNEMVLPIEHYLMGKPGTRPESIEVIYSHPQALAQCREYLETRFPSAVRSASLSTAQAVGDAIASTVPAAAIAPRRSAELYSAEILDSGIQDVAANATRFVVLAKTDHPPTGNDKTSLFFTFDEDVPGQLTR